MAQSKPTTTSFRAQTTGAVSDLLQAEGESNASSQNLLVYLAGALLDYRDEGIEFSPAIVLCASIKKFLQSLPGAVTYEIGKVPFAAESGVRILKDCAPLSGPNWSIYIEHNKGSEVSYGVFSYSRSPTSVTLHDSMTLRPDTFAILTRKTGPGIIEMRGTKGNIATFIFSTQLEQDPDEPHIRRFVSDCCSDCPKGDQRNDFQLYFSRLIATALAASHGTILVCCNNPNMNSIPGMSDAVPLIPTLDFYTAFGEYKRALSAESILYLQRCEDLLFGLLRCDGIVAFDTKGQIQAYRVFFKSTGEASTNSPVIVGGARRRAFEGVKKLSKKDLRSALFRSQDGTTLHHKVTK